LRLAKLGGKTIRVAAELLVATSLGAAARLTRMQLQAQLQMPVRPQVGEGPKEAHKGALEFRYASLSKQLGRGVKSVRSAVKQLEQAEWLDLAQTNRVAPVMVAARNPIQEHYEQLAADAGCVSVGLSSWERLS